MLTLKELLKFAYRTTFLAVLFVLLANLYIVKATQSRIFFSAEKTPATEMGLVLGTSEKLSNQTPNLFFEYRIDAAAKLYESGKVKKLILSGNNDSKYYNEPRRMQAHLLKKGIPIEDLILDFKGYRTFDSIFRAKHVFGYQRFTIISQSFHVQRAAFIGQKLGVDVSGFCAQDLPVKLSFKTLFREYFARPLSILDSQFFHPKISSSNEEIK